MSSILLLLYSVAVSMLSLDRLHNDRHTRGGSFVIAAIYIFIQLLSLSLSSFLSSGWCCVPYTC